MASGWSREGTSVCAIPKPLAPLCSPVPLSCPADFTPRTCCVALGWAFSLSGTQHTLLVGWSRRLPQPWHFESPCVQLTLGADFQATAQPTGGCSPAWVGWSTRMLRVSFAVADIDECALPTGGHICSYRCINVPGSFQCSCPSTGYRLAPNGRNCQGEWGGVLGSPRPSRGSAGRGEPESQQPQHTWVHFGRTTLYPGCVLAPQAPWSPILRHTYPEGVRSPPVLPRATLGGPEVGPMAFKRKTSSIKEQDFNTQQTPQLSIAV